MFFAKTKDDKLFSNKVKEHGPTSISKRRSEFLKPEKLPPLLKEAHFEEEIKYNRYAQISNSEKLLLFFHLHIPCIAKFSTWKKKE